MFVPKCGNRERFLLCFCNLNFIKELGKKYFGEKKVTERPQGARVFNWLDTCVAF